MKTTLKPWQITLLSIFTIMFAVILSIFCLKADTIDEETGDESGFDYRYLILIAAGIPLIFLALKKKDK